MRTIKPDIIQNVQLTSQVGEVGPVSALNTFLASFKEPTKKLHIDSLKMKLVAIGVNSVGGYNDVMTTLLSFFIAKTANGVAVATTEYNSYEIETLVDAGISGDFAFVLLTEPKLFKQLYLSRAWNGAAISNLAANILSATIDLTSEARKALRNIENPETATEPNYYIGYILQSDTAASDLIDIGFTYDIKYHYTSQRPKL